MQNPWPKRNLFASEIKGLIFPFSYIDWSRSVQMHISHGIDQRLGLKAFSSDEVPKILNKLAIIAR
jgi:hypothetical protein